MADIRKISVFLSEDQAVALKNAVDAGEYATTSEIVEEALHDWQFKREIRPEDIERLRQSWDDGKGSGIGRPYDIERTLGAARRRRKRAAAG